MGSLGTYIRQLYPPSPEWTVDKISDLSGKVFIVTGGSSGIGKETCKQLLLKNAKVYLAARSESKAQEALDELEKETGKKAIFQNLDLADLDAVKKSAQEFLECVTSLSLSLRAPGQLSCQLSQKGDQVERLSCECSSDETSGRPTHSPEVRSPVRHERSRPPPLHPTALPPSCVNRYPRRCRQSRLGLIRHPISLQTSHKV